MHTQKDKNITKYRIEVDDILVQIWFYWLEIDWIV
jgi:hypothetical protein